MNLDEQIKFVSDAAARAVSSAAEILEIAKCAGRENDDPFMPAIEGLREEAASLITIENTLRDLRSRTTLCQD
jgi:hypothetical protein